MPADIPTTMRLYSAVTGSQRPMLGWQYTADNSSVYAYAYDGVTGAAIGSIVNGTTLPQGAIAGTPVALASYPGARLQGASFIGPATAANGLQAATVDALANVLIPMLPAGWTWPTSFRG